MLNLSAIAAHHKTCGAPSEAATCPRCGTWSPINEIRPLRFWEPSLLRPTIMTVRVGCYLCPRCPQGQRWFTARPPAYRTTGQYSLVAKDHVVALVRKFRMSIDAAAAVGRELFHLSKLHPTTVLDWIRQAGDQVDVAAWHTDAVAIFSGQMAIDEVYDGDWYQLKATDPLNDIELYWSVGEGSPNEDDIRAFCIALKELGFMPELVVTDGSKLYPKVIAEVWPDAEHQRCVFHFVKQANEDISRAFWVAYKTMPVPPKRGRGRPKKRGRKRKDKLKRENRRKVRACRYLLMKRHLSEDERARLDEAIGLCPPLGELRRFVQALHKLFGPTTDSHALAEQRRKALLDDSSFAAIDKLGPVLKRLSDDDLFSRLTRYLDFENADKTSNHVERQNREYRNRQKTHYRIRSLATLCALLDLLMTGRPRPDTPVKLRRRPIKPADKEVKKAA